MKRSLIAQAETLFGVEPWVAKGVLAEEPDDISVEDAQATIAHFLANAVSGSAVSLSGQLALVFIGEQQPPGQLRPALWIPTEDDPANPGTKRPQSVDKWQVFLP